MTQLTPSTPLIPAARHEGDALVASIAGEIDMHNSPDVRNGLFALLKKTEPRRVVLNLAGVPYMDSSGVAVLVEMLREMRQIGGKVYLASPQPRVRGLLEIAKLNSLFVLVDSEADALAGQ